MTTTTTDGIDTAIASLPPIAVENRGRQSLQLVPWPTKLKPRTGRLRMVLGATDAASVTVALALFVHHGSLNQRVALLVMLWLVVGASCFCIYAHPRRRFVGTRVEVNAVVGWAVCCTGLTAVFDAPLGPTSAALVCSMTAAGAATGRVVTCRIWRHRTPPSRVLMIGSADLGERIARKFELDSSIRAEIVRQVSPKDLMQGSATPEDVTQKLVSVALATRCDRFVVGMDDLPGKVMRAIGVASRTASVPMSVLPTIDGAISANARVTHLAELQMLETHVGPVPPWVAWVKRAMDIVGSGIAILLSLPVMAVIAVAVRLESAGPIFFRQQRGGLGGVPFSMFKFRTMVPDAESRLSELIDLSSLRDPMFKLDNDPRITKVGAFLRKSSLDELPQLFNVFMGRMSLVGPRPEDIRLVARYEPDALAVRCGVRPGLTGPMQVHGRGRLTFEERLAVERHYVENHSLALDIRLLLATPRALLSRNGAF